MLFLMLLGAITGSVIHPDGAPFGGVHLSAYRVGAPSRVVLASAVSDRNGAFKLDTGYGMVEVVAEHESSLATVRAPGDEDALAIVLDDGAPTEPGTTSYPNSNPDNGAAIKGTVRDTAGHPLPGLRVFVQNDRGISYTYTNEKGAYALKAAGRELKVFAGEDEGRYFESVAVTLTPPGTHDFVLNRFATIDGVLREYDDKPIAGASVSTVAEGVFAMQEQPVAVTDSTGRFRLHVPARFTGRVTASKSAMPPAVSEELTISEKGLRGLVLRVSRGIVVKGRVRGTGGNGIGEVAIHSALNDVNDVKQYDWGTTAADGSFSLRMNEGPAILRFSKDGYVTAAVPIEVTSSLRPIDLTLKPIVFVRGTLVRKDGTPVDDWTIRSPDAIEETRTSSDGSFELAFAAPGAFEVSTSDAPPTIVHAPAEDVRLQLDEGLAIHGRIIDAVSREAIEGAAISAETKRQIYMPLPDSGPGEFTFTGLPPGEVTLAVMARNYVHTSVPAEAGQATPVTIALKRAVAVRGHVRDSDGSPVVGAAVYGQWGNIGSDERGDFELTDIDPDEPLVLTIERQEYLGQKLEVPRAKLGDPVEIVMSRGATVKGRVTSYGSIVPFTLVTAESISAGVTSRSAAADGDGQFVFDALPPGRYDFGATEPGRAGKGTLRGVDVDGVREITIQLEPRPSGTLTGRVTGLPATTVSKFAVVSTETGPQSGAILEDGTFRIEALPAGKVTVTVTASTFGGLARVAVKEVTIPAGGEAHAEFAFGAQRVLRGRVTRAGVPARRIVIAFNGDSRGNAVTDESGRYELNLEPGHYTAVVLEPENGGTLFSGEVDVDATAVYDIVIDTATVRVRVLDGATGEPIEDAQVTIRAGEAALVTATSGADGVALLEYPRTFRAAGYRITASAIDYGESSVNIAAPADEVRVVLARDHPKR